MKRSIEWAAGLFEGEGSIWQRKNVNNFEVKIDMTDRDVLESFADTIGVGKVTLCTAEPNRKQKYRWRVMNHKDVRYVLDALLPYFGNRRAHKALDVLDNLELQT